uniref:Uncharacterized protein n=1 Tax=Anguilla anguilla TaxID=7936 RepID=A0A0E9XFC0_ANGAN
MHVGLLRPLCSQNCSVAVLNTELFCSCAQHRTAQFGLCSVVLKERSGASSCSL